MLRWLVVATLVACDSSAPPAGAPARAPAPVVATVAVDAGTPADAAAVEAAPIVTMLAIPDALAAAPRWIGRRLLTGKVRETQTHETFTLQRKGKDALVTVELKHGHKRGGAPAADGEASEWRTVSTTQYLGTVRSKRRSLTLDVANGADKLALSCKRTKLKVAPANAVRGRTPAMIDDECGDTGRWVPGTVKPLDAFVCTALDVVSRKRLPGATDDTAKLAFAAAPGIEWVHVNDDCVIQGGGWRAVPAGGSIRTVREPEHYVPSKSGR